MKTIVGYFFALKRLLYKKYLEFKYSGLKVHGNLIIGKRVKFLMEPGSLILFLGDITIQDDVVFDIKSNVKIEVGHKTYFNRSCSIVIHNGLNIGENVMFGENVKIYDNDHKIEDGKVLRRTYETSPIFIGDRCWIANSAIILKGTIMGPDTVIAALSLASGNLDSNALYMGVPCRKMKKLNS